MQNARLNIRPFFRSRHAKPIRGRVHAQIKPADRAGNRRAEAPDIACQQFKSRVVEKMRYHLRAVRCAVQHHDFQAASKLAVGVLKSFLQPSTDKAGAACYKIRAPAKRRQKVGVSDKIRSRSLAGRAGRMVQVRD